MKKTLIIPLLVSLIIASLALYVGLQHNSMGEFCKEVEVNCNIDYLYSAGIWSAWYITSFVVQISIIYILKLLLHFKKRVLTKRSSRTP